MQNVSHGQGVHAVSSGNYGSGADQKPCVSLADCFDAAFAAEVAKEDLLQAETAMGATQQAFERNLTPASDQRFGEETEPPTKPVQEATDEASPIVAPSAAVSSAAVAACAGTSAAALGDSKPQDVVYLRDNALYCTPHVKVPGQLHVTTRRVQFMPEMSSHQEQMFGCEDYEVSIEVFDLLECVAVIMPVEEEEIDSEAGMGQVVDEMACFLQLHVRTLDGQRFCTPEDTEHAWCVVFQMRGRGVLYEVAHMLLKAMSFAKARRHNLQSDRLAQGSRTSVPFPSLDCAAFFEAAAQKRLQREQQLVVCANPTRGAGRRRRRREKTSNASASSSTALAASHSPATTAAPLVALQPMGVAQPLLTQRMAESIIDYLPVRVRVPGAVEWVLRYTPKVHGVSLGTLYRQVADHDMTLLLVQDAEEYIFGGFAPEPWEPCGKFYGSGEAFVFTLGRVTASHAKTLPGRENAARFYPWTSTNSFFMYSDYDIVAMGGGDGHYAIAIGDDLLKGHSSATPTFGNPPLASAEEFVVRNIEIWALEDVA